MERYKGEVIWFKAKPEGFGFISWEGKDMFVHFSGISMVGYKTLQKGQKVTFSIGKNNRNQDIAIDVVVDE